MASKFRTFMDMNLAIEEEALNDGISADGEMKIEEVIAFEETAEAFNNQANEIEAGIDTIDESTQVAEDLQTQVDATNEIIETKPDEITEDTVKLNQEMFIVSLGKLGYTSNDLKSVLVTHEADVPAVTRLRISNEAISDTIKHIWEKIKAFFAKIGGAIKNLYAKATILFSGVEKKAKALINSIEKKSELSEIKEENASSAAKSLGFLCSFNNDINKILPNYMKYRVFLDKLFTTNISTDNIDSPDLSLLSKEIFNTVDSNYKIVAFTIAPSVVNVYTVSNDNEETKKNGISVKVFKLTDSDNFQDSLAKQLTGTRLNKSDVIKILNSVITEAKQFEKTRNNANKFRDTLYNKLDKQLKDMSVGDVKARESLRYYSMLANGFTFSALMSHIRSISSVYQAVAKLV